MSWIEEWNPDSRISGLEDLRANLRKAHAAAKTDIVLGFTGRPVAGRLGSTVPFCRTTVVADRPELTEDQNVEVLAHELAHLFGAQHAGESQSSASQNPLTPGVDAAAAAMIRRFRYFDFRRGRAESKEVLDYFASLAVGPANIRQARAQTAVGVLLLDDGQTDTAVRLCRKAVELAPDDPPARLRLGTALLKQGQPGAAAAEFEAVQKLQPGNPEAHQQLGLAFAAQGKMEEAVREFQETIRRRITTWASLCFGVAASRRR